MTVDRLPFTSGFGSHGYGAQRFGIAAKANIWAQLGARFSYMLPTLMGRDPATQAPAHGWVFKQEFGVTAADLVGSVALVPTNSPVQGITSTPLKTTAVRFFDGNSHKMAGAAADNIEQSGSWAFAALCTITPMASGRQLGGKRAGLVAANAGWHLECGGSGAVSLEVADGATEVTISANAVADSADALGMLWGVNDTTNTMFLHCRRATTTFSASGTPPEGSHANASSLMWGAVTTNSCPIETALLTHFHSAAAEGLTAAHLIALMQALALE